jgi:hypothetical protein
MCSIVDLLRKAKMASPQSQEAINDLGRLIDAAEDIADIELLGEAVAIADAWLLPNVQALNSLAIEFYRANGFLGLFNAKVSLKQISSSDWDQPDLESGLLALRRVIADVTFASWPAVRKAQAHTNLGNALSTLGRPVDALRSRDEALRHVPHFGMALGTRAESLDALAGTVYQRRERKALLAAAADGFKETQNQSTVFEANYDNVRDKWSARQAVLSEWLERTGWPDRSHYAEHVTDGLESNYIQWCLDQRLMLNASNESGPLWIAGNDYMHLPPMRATAVSADLMGMFDAMLSEFESARWSIYESLQAPRPTIDALLRPHDTGDAPRFGLSAERAKSSYRTAYSVLDRIAFFLNAYLGIGVKPGDISFRQLWTLKNGSVRPEFTASQNWALRGLYFISRDLFEDGFRESLAPDAQILAKVRHRLEHRYVRVVDGDVAPAAAESDLVYRIGMSDLQNKALRLLQLTRSALIALGGAVLIKERDEVAGGHAYTHLPLLPRLIARQPPPHPESDPSS